MLCTEFNQTAITHGVDQFALLLLALSIDHDRQERAEERRRRKERHHQENLRRKPRSIAPRPC